MLKCIITGDETLVYGYDIETKVKSSEWTNSLPGESRKKSPASSIKCLSSPYSFFYYNGIVCHEFLPLVHAINKEYYIAVMCRLQKLIRKKI